MVETLTTSGAVFIKAGDGYDVYKMSGAVVTQLINEAEGLMCAVARADLIGGYSGYTSGAQYFLNEIASDLAAIYVINADMSGYPTRAEAEDKVNILRDAAIRGLSLLRDQKVVDWL